MSKTWKLMKLAFEYYSLGFQRIIFMILGAQVAFLMCYLFFCDILYGTTRPALPAGYAVGSETLTGAMVMAGLVAVTVTIKFLLAVAAVALIVGYVKHYLVVLSYYDEEKYAGYKGYRADKTPHWLMAYGIGQEAERERLKAVEDCMHKCKVIRESPE
jgi:hypothetical protein